MTDLIPDANTSDVLAEFYKTRRQTDDKAKDEDDYYQALVALRPDRLDIDQIAEIVKWVEATKRPQPDYGPHVNIFGTGGDGTINVSSMAAIIASHFTRVVKVGTPGVTSLWGSFDFMQALQRYLREKSAGNEPVHPFMKWGEGSRYIALSELGFAYNTVLRQARRRLKATGIPDIYKVVFPFANYTNPQIQINGVSTKVYLNIYDQLAGYFKRASCIVDSEFDIDELMPGRNEIRCWVNERGHRLNWQFCESSEDGVWKLVDEKDSAEETVSLFSDVLNGDADPAIQQTILYNAALIIAMQQFAVDQSLEVDMLIKNAHLKISQAIKARY